VGPPLGGALPTARFIRARVAGGSQIPCVERQAAWTSATRAPRGTPWPAVRQLSRYSPPALRSGRRSPDSSGSAGDAGRCTSACGTGATRPERISSAAASISARSSADAGRPPARRAIEGAEARDEAVERTYRAVQQTSRSGVGVSCAADRVPRDDRRRCPAVHRAAPAIHPAAPAIHPAAPAIHPAARTVHRSPRVVDRRSPAAERVARDVRRRSRAVGRVSCDRDLVAREVRQGSRHADRVSGAAGRTCSGGQQVPRAVRRICCNAGRVSRAGDRIASSSDTIGAFVGPLDDAVGLLVPPPSCGTPGSVSASPPAVGAFDGGEVLERA